ncbi:hypothetical protein EJ02DRAFT_454428 [Clathrospora elynae]|uniref:Uncharacterized protein n=1 Tax=Clathrospora elynae TaxID=706981 RepID=A0A6A5SRN7_9PLEO|nr:hypothetical protein EJ02DRAFT_454428 [Clathrospora elynae]
MSLVACKCCASGLEALLQSQRAADSETNWVGLVTSEADKSSMPETNDQGVREIDSYGDQGDFECGCQTR